MCSVAFFFYKQKTAYELRISDGSSDVGSSDLAWTCGAGRIRPESPCATRPETEMRRVVVTGMGAVTPLGCGADACWKRLVEGESGISAVQAFHVSDLPANDRKRDV